MLLVINLLNNIKNKSDDTLPNLESLPSDSSYLASS